MMILMTTTGENYTQGTNIIHSLETSEDSLTTITIWMPGGVTKSFKFNSSWYQLQRNVSRMANFNDESIGNTAKMLKSNGMWNDKLLIVATDSGGPSGIDGNAANNCPLRGGKYSDFPRRYTCSISCVWWFVQQNKRGIKLNGTMLTAHWFQHFVMLSVIILTKHDQMQPINVKRK